MAYNGWLRYGGIEIANNARAGAYIANGYGNAGMLASGCGCPTLDPLIGETFVSPLTDGAPWLDPKDPSSRVTTGLFVTKFDGLDDPIGGRDIYTNAKAGGTLGPLRFGPKVLGVEGWVFGRTEGALDAYLNWLTLVLTGRSCNTSIECGLGTLEFYSACPSALVAPCNDEAVTEVITYDLTPWAESVIHGIECGGGGWVVDGTSIDDSCVVANTDLVCYPMLPELLAGGSAVDYSAICPASAEIRTEFGEAYGVTEPAIGVGTGFVNYPTGAGCGGSVNGLGGTTRRDTVMFTFDAPVTGAVTGNLAASFRVATASGSLGVGVYDIATGAWLDVAGQTSPNGINAGVNASGTSFSLSTWNSALGNWTMTFDAAGHDIANLRLVFWAVNGTTPEVVDTISAAYTVGGNVTVDHGCNAAGWYIDTTPAANGPGVNVDPTPSGTLAIWHSAADLTAWMNTHDPYDHTWTYDATNQEICAIVDSADSARYRLLLACVYPANIASSVNATVTPIPPTSVCPTWISAQDVAQWLTLNDPHGLTWAADGRIVTATAPPGVGASYGPLDGCFESALSPTITLDDGSVDETTYLASFYRQARNVGVVSGPEILSTWSTGGVTRGYRIGFEMVSESPYLFGPIEWLTNTAFEAGSLDNGAFHAPLDVTCSDASEYFPDCFPDQPDIPILTTAGCYEAPQYVFRHCGILNNVDVREASTVFEITAGTEELRNLRFMAFERRPGDRICPACGTVDGLTSPDLEWFDCNRKIGAVEVSQLPAGSTLFIDGRDLDATLTLADGTELPGARFISGENGTPLAYLDIAPCTEVCLLVETDWQNTNDATAFRAGLVPRYTVGGR